MKFPLVLRKRFTRLKEQNREARDRLAAATLEYEQAVLASKSAPEMFVGLAKTLDFAGLYPIGVCRS